MKFGKRNAATGGDGHGSLVSSAVLALVVIWLFICLLVGWYWSSEPDLESVAGAPQPEMVNGEYTARTLRAVVQTLLEKPGG